jgi:predicted RNase H-like nuclease (RuvC/YqgF family)
VYEEIIDNLKAEVKRKNAETHSLETRCETFRRQAARVEQLQEEREMYKTMSTSSLNERDE